MSPDAALDLSRFARDMSAMFLWGSSAYLALLVTGDLAADVWRRLRPGHLAAVAVAAIATVLSLPIETALIGNGWQDALNPSIAGDVLLTTTVGQSWLVQMVASLALLASLALSSPWQMRVTALAAGVFLAGAALTGHAAMQDGWAGIAHRANDALHVLAAGAWLGALVPLTMILARPTSEERQRQTTDALRRFSTAGHWIVGLVVASGIANTGLTLGRPPTDWSSPYQALLAAKIALVAAMVALALANRYAFVPRLAADRDKAVAEIRRGTIAEITLGAIVVGLVAAFGMLDPT